MPIIPSSYKAPLWLPGRHAETIVPNLFRVVEGVQYVRERIFTPDNDFLDLDWSCQGSSCLAIIAHGLEGHTSRPYVLGMVKELNKAGWDTLSWHFRSCSGEINNAVQLYHAGSFHDLACVVSHAASTKRYKEIVLIGFSLGGNVILKYLAESSYPSEVSKAVGFSIPCDLLPCVQELNKRFNWIYLYRFIDSLKSKLEKKVKLYPEALAHLDIDKIENLIDFDNHFTAPLNGFRDAFHYYDECSTKKNILDIHIPVLIINAQNDPFMNESCSPIKECKESKFVHLEMPLEGGHLGFMKNDLHGQYWSEQRTLEFLSNKIF